MEHTSDKNKGTSVDNQIIPGINVVRKGEDLDVTLQGGWYDLYYRYRKIRYYFSRLYWRFVFPLIVNLAKIWPLSIFFQDYLRRYEHKKELVVIEKISKISKKLNNPVIAEHIIETDMFIVYPCHIITKSKSNWQEKFEKMLTKELGTNNFFIRPSMFFDNTIDVMIPKDS